MKSSVYVQTSAAAALLTAAALIVSMSAQEQRSTAKAATGAPPLLSNYPLPTNLKVLPKAMSGQQVQEMMEQWSIYLSVQCDGCHVEDREKPGPDGRPLLNFADDRKPMKMVARTMYAMTEEINSKYLAKIDSSGVPVNCATCHRGRVGPQLFSLPVREMPKVVQGKPLSGDGPQF